MREPSGDDETPLCLDDDSNLLKAETVSGG